MDLEAGGMGVAGVAIFVHRWQQRRVEGGEVLVLRTGSAVIAVSSTIDVVLGGQRRRQLIL